LLQRLEQLEQISGVARVDKAKAAVQSAKEFTPTAGGLNMPKRTWAQYLTDENGSIANPFFRGRKAFRKPIHFPSYQTVSVRMDHVLANHTPNGQVAIARARAGKPNSVFPPTWDEARIESAVREAYKNMDTQLKLTRWTRGDNAFQDVLTLEGSGGGIRIQFFYNKVTQTIESAWPVTRSPVSP
jgi:hypothetical protein